MDMVATDDKPRAFHQFSGPPAPMPRMHAPEPTHGLPGSGPPNPYDQPYRPYPTPYDSHHGEPRRASNAPQPPITSHVMFPPIPGRELPQISSSEGPYGRTPSVPTPTHASVEALPPPHANFHPMNAMNGAPQDSSPLSAPPEYRARMSFGSQDQPTLTNGDPPPPPQSLPPTHYPTTAPPPSSQTPVPVDANYHYSQQYLRQQRKATRAQQACDQCRSRKAKCDEGRPSCSHCKENGLQCVYKEVPPHKQDKTTREIMDKLRDIEDKADGRGRNAERLHLGHDKTLDSHLKKFETHVKEFKDQASKVKEIHKMLTHLLSGDDVAEKPQSSVIKTDGSEVPIPNPETKEQVPHEAEQAHEADDFSKDLEPGNQPGEENELSIPVEHTTAAHKLLEWESIKTLLHRYDPHYVMEIEEGRRFLRLEGRGETRKADNSPVQPSPAQPLPSQPTSFNSTLEDDQSRYTSPTATWSSNPRYNDAPTEIRGINEYGVVSIDANLIRRFFRNYLEYIHKLHPFLDENDLRHQIEEFIARHCPTSSQSATRLSAREAVENRGAKRKRSGETAQAMGYGQQSPPTIQFNSAPQRVGKTISNATILLVLALGRICEVQNEPIRGPCTDQLIDYRREPIPTVPQAKGSPSHRESIRPLQSSFYSPYGQAAGTPSTTDETFITLPDHPDLENVDTVPGLVYYTYAVNILGNCLGDTELEYVQATLLAGLYMGQLANPFQSQIWIALAARTCQILTLPRNYEKLPEGPRKELVCFAFWTCLQLESDILAELDLPASGISRAESRIKLPQGTFTMRQPQVLSDPSTMMMFYYSAQTHLRKVLNRVHTDLYKKKNKGERSWSTTTSEILSMNLNLWRRSLPKEMEWFDDEEPAKDINVARMRAKYYGARYIIHRPLLWHALNEWPKEQINQEQLKQEHQAQTHSQNGASPITHPDSGPILNQMSPAPGQDLTRVASNLSASQNPYFQGKTYRDMPRELRRGCKECLDSAVKSTIAFDGVPGRPVVTNIFGTAHAQFGNMLVLSTAYQSSHLRELVNRSELERLLVRTIKFLLRNRNISPTLRADARILHEIYEVIFGEPPVLTGNEGPN